jgi:hypothetical protein
MNIIIFGFSFQVIMKQKVFSQVDQHSSKYDTKWKNKQTCVFHDASHY